MPDCTNNLEVLNNTLDLNVITEVLNEAISQKYSVELRIEDLPKMDIDTSITTTINEVVVNEEMSFLRLVGPMLTMIFKYKKYSLGTSSSQHHKFYFESDGAILTVIVRY